MLSRVQHASWFERGTVAALIVLAQSAEVVSGYRSASKLFLGGAGSGGDLFACDINSASASPCSSQKKALSSSGVGVDPPNKRVYYTYRKGIASCDPDGSNIAHFFSKITVSNQWSSLTIDADSRKMYLVDVDQEKIVSLPLDNPDYPEDVNTGGTVVVRALAIDTTTDPKYLYWSEKSSISRIELPSGSTTRLQNSVFADYYGIALHSDGTDTFLYAANAGSSAEVTRFKVNDADNTLETVLSTAALTADSISSPRSLSIDARLGMLYLSDEVAKAVFVSTLAGSVQSFHANIEIKNTAAVLFEPVAAISLSVGSVTLVEGAVEGYTVTLDRDPTHDVVVAVAVNAQFSQQLTLTPSSLTFKPDTWDIPQTVSVAAVKDAVDLGVRTLIIYHNTSSTDAKYSGISGSTLAVTVGENHREKVMWGDVVGSNQNLYRANRKDGSGSQRVGNLQFADIRAVSSGTSFTPPFGNVTERIFWIDAEDDNLGTAELDGSNAFDILSGDALTYPAAMDVARLTGDSGNTNRVFWVDRTTGEFSSVSLDESGKATTNTTVLLSELGNPVSLAVDYCRNQVYWGDASGAVNRQSMSIGSDGLVTAGSSKEVLVAAAVPASSNRALSIALDLRERMLYWADGAAGTISRKPLDSSSSVAEQDPWLSPSDSAVPVQIAVDAMSKQLYWVDGWLAGGNDGKNTIRRTAITTAMGSDADTSVIVSNLANPRSMSLSPSMPTARVTVGGTSNIPSILEGTAVNLEVRMEQAVVAGADVVVDVSLSQAVGDLSAGTVSPRLITFTSANWDVAQTVTVTAVDDKISQGGRSYHLALAVVLEKQGSEAKCTAPPSPPTGVTYVHVEEDDAVSLVLEDCHGESAHEGGSDQICKLRLNSEPLKDVAVAVAGDDSGTQVDFSPISLTFSPSNWATWQSIRVSALDDTMHDTDADNSIKATFTSTSADAGYLGLTASATLAVVDNDPISIVLGESSLRTAETRDVTYTVALGSTPHSYVVVDVTAPSECFQTLSVGCWPVGVTASPPRLNFTTANWAAPQTVTLTPIDDQVDAGDRTFDLAHQATSSDARYQSVAQAGPKVTVTEDDSVGTQWDITTGDSVGEGKSRTVNLKLTSVPSTTVTVKLATHRESEDGRTCTLSVSAVVFTAQDWDTFKPVVLTMGEDTQVKVDFNVYISTEIVSSDPTYDGLAGKSKDLRVIENDFAGIVTEYSAKAMQENSTVTYTITLRSMPTSAVVISPEAQASVPLVFLDNTLEPEQLSFSPSTLTFDSNTWSRPQTVTMHAFHDQVDNGAGSQILIKHAAVSRDSRYKGKGADVTLTNNNIDTANLTVSATQLQLVEGGLAEIDQKEKTAQTATTGEVVQYDLTMHTKPRSAVTVYITPTTMKWADSAAASSAGTCDALPPTPPNMTAVNAKAAAAAKQEALAAAAISNTTAANSNSSNNGSNATNNSTPAPTPMSAVQIYQMDYARWEREQATCERTKTSAFAGVTVVPSALTFTQDNWADPRTITVTATDDSLIQQDRSQQLFHEILSADTHYDDFQLPEVWATVREDDAPGTVLNWSHVPKLISGDANSNASAVNRVGDQVRDALTDVTYRCGHAVVVENSTAQYTVRLSAKPVAEVTVRIWMPSHSASDMMLHDHLQHITFGPGSWDREQTVTLDVLDNENVDGDRKWAIHHTMRSDDALFDFPRSELYFGNVSLVALQEAAEKATAAAAGGGDSTPLDITTPPTWNFVNDTLDELLLTEVVSIALVHVGDNDRAQVAIESTRVSLYEGADLNFTVRLTSVPTGPVTVTATPQRLVYWKYGVRYQHQLAVTPGSLVFTPADWKNKQQFKIIADDDKLMQGDRPDGELVFTVESADPKYDSTSALTCQGGGVVVQSACVRDNPTELDVTLRDNDQKGVALSTSDMRLERVTRISGTAGFVEGSYELFIQSEPVAAVTVVVTLATTADPPAVLNAREVVFSPEKWDLRQPVAITADNDHVFNGYDVKHATVSHSVTSSDPLYSDLELPPLCVTWKDDEIDSGCPTEHQCVNGGTCTVTRACDCPSPFGGQGCSNECSAERCNFERMFVTLRVDDSREAGVTADEVRITLQQAFCEEAGKQQQQQQDSANDAKSRRVLLDDTWLPDDTLARRAAGVVTSEMALPASSAAMECKSAKGDGGLCPDVQITVLDMAERQCIDQRTQKELGNETRGTVPCLLCKIDIAGSDEAYKTLEKMYETLGSDDENTHMAKLGMRGLSEEVMYDKCAEFLGCFPEKVKFEEAVVCGTIATLLFVGACIIWKSGSSVAAGQVAPAPPGAKTGKGGAPSGPVKPQKALRTAFKGLAI